MQSNPKIRVAICGGGVGGLTLAYSLSQSAGVDVDVYEAASRFAEIGAGVALSKRTLRALTAMGLEDDIAAISGRQAQKTEGRMIGIDYKRADQGVIEHFFLKTARDGLVAVHRAEFHGMLVSKLPPNTRTYTSKRLVSYLDKPGSPIELIFSDGTKATCDVLVGADGLKSVVRTVMYEGLAALAALDGKTEEATRLHGLIAPRYSGATTFRTTFPREKLERTAPDHPVFTESQMYLGRNQIFMSYCVSQGKVINVVASVMDYSLYDTAHPEPWVSQVDTQEFVKSYDGWAEEARKIISCTEGEEMKKWVVNFVHELPTYAYARAALLGDAAHAMTPYLGAGAGQAIEDAYVLAALLTHPRTTRETVPDVLKIYSDMRQPVATKLAAMAALNGRTYALPEGTGRDDVAKQGQNATDLVEAGDPLIEAQRAVQVLETIISA